MDSKQKGKGKGKGKGKHAKQNQENGPAADDHTKNEGKKEQKK